MLLYFASVFHLHPETEDDLFDGFNSKTSQEREVLFLASHKTLKK